MALRIKKNIKQPDGTFIELEGTEAEIEAYEKKQLKKQQVNESKKKPTLLGKMTEDELRKLIAEEIAKQPHNHYHYNTYANPSFPKWNEWYRVNHNDNGIFVGNSQPQMYGTISGDKIVAGQITADKITAGETVFATSGAKISVSAPSQTNHVCGAINTIDGDDLKSPCFIGYNSVADSSVQ